MSVILSTKVGVCMMLLPVLLPGPMSLLGGLCLWSHVLSRVVSVQGGPGLGVSVQEVSLQGDLCPGGSLSGIRYFPPWLNHTNNFFLKDILLKSKEASCSFEGDVTTEY